MTGSMKLRFLCLLCIVALLPAFADADDAQTDNASELKVTQPEETIKSNLAANSTTIFGYSILALSQVQIILDTLSADDNNISVLKSAYDALKAQKTALAQNQQTPEACIIKALSGEQQSSDNLSMIRFNCIRQYILNQMPHATDVNAPGFGPSATLYYFPEIESLQSITPAQIEIQTPNNGESQIIAADILLQDKANPSDIQVDRVYADLPIDAHVVGTLDGSTMLNLDSLATFTSKYNWYFQHIWAVTPP